MVRSEQLLTASSNPKDGGHLTKSPSGQQAGQNTNYVPHRKKKPRGTSCHRWFWSPPTQPSSEAQLVTPVLERKEVCEGPRSIFQPPLTQPRHSPGCLAESRSAAPHAHSSGPPPGTSPAGTGTGGSGASWTSGTAVTCQTGLANHTYFQPLFLHFCVSPWQG